MLIAFTEMGAAVVLLPFVCKLTVATGTLRGLCSVQTMLEPIEPSFYQLANCILSVFIIACLDLALYPGPTDLALYPGPIH